MELVAEFPLRPIQNEDHLDQALAVIDSLIELDRLLPDEDDYLDVLGDIVHKYEADRRHSEPPLSDAAMLRHLMESREINQSQLAEATGIAASTVSAILLGNRSMNCRHLKAFARYFRVDPSLFFSDWKDGF